MIDLLPLLHNQRQPGCCCTRSQGEHELTQVDTQRVNSTQMTSAARSADDTASLVVQLMHLAHYCWRIQAFGVIAHDSG